MNSTKFTLEEITGYLGIGSMYLFGFYLFLSPLFSRQYPTFSTGIAIVSTIPIIVIAYILGIFFTALMDLFLSSIFRIKPFSNRVFKQVSKSNNDLLIQKFKEVDKNIKLLKGSSFAFLIVGFGCFRFGDILGSILFPTGIIAAILSPILSIRIRNQFYELSSELFESV